ncbi:hypothetical protein WISP_76221 [Willisornis vidua]|uniref:Uncharacterized protein n=1 Tax=Willisornis vidua TaxID=1566151 RepID=A0ABQ9DC51_9PASS|nr:hypothetical protein WISP_76221 [Willisornis vidua]
MLKQGPGRTCGAMGRGAHAGAGLLAGLVTPLGTHLSLKDLHPVEGTHIGSVYDELNPVGKIHVEEVCRELFSCERDPTPEQKKSVRTKE